MYCEIHNRRYDSDFILECPRCEDIPTQVPCTSDEIRDLLQAAMHDTPHGRWAYLEILNQFDLQAITIKALQR
jgi:hypothetical protein